ncbi:uncharacterized protein LOC143518315 [Brachyhypopomus gauderio]|uniref:uncharacterized protein LOC143518315 n=1 Tax=Brachyhypopomus gauderio TaxID=698409 RepID=UPI004041AEC9
MPAKQDPVVSILCFMVTLDFQKERQDLLMYFDDTDSDMEVDEQYETTSKETKGHLDSTDILSMTSYMRKHKMIPEELSEDFCVVREVPKKFETLETICPYCPGPTPPELSPPKLFTKEAVVYGLCSVTKAALKNHTAIGRALSIVEDLSGCRVPHDPIRKAFFHFSALRDYKYGFFCYRCGHHPSIIVADANWKVAFDIPVQVLKKPNPETVRAEDLSVNMKEKWQNLENEMIASGLCTGGRTHNPFSNMLTYSDLAPWIGVNTRTGDIVPKTELLKGLWKKTNVGRECQVANTEMNEDYILDLLEKKKAQKAELVSACEALGVSAEGTREDILNRLQELLLYKDIYPKMFVKLQKAGGGVLHVSCPHSVVYYCSPLWWRESARDHADALLSFQHAPNVYVSDVAGRVARHLNNRTKQDFFQPYDGRLCEPTKDNIEKALKKTLQISLPWLTSSQPKGIKEMDCTSMHSRPHPVTGTNERYSLYDRFHQKNQKRPEERLRSLCLVPELRSSINTAVAEQLNREMASSRYFLCNMKDRHFIFSLRLMFHLHNQKVNQEFKQDMMRIALDPLEVDNNGRLSIAETAHALKKEGVIEVMEMKGLLHEEESSRSWQHFSVGLFPIDQSNEEKVAVLFAEQKEEHLTIIRIANCTANLQDLKSLYPPEMMSSEEQSTGKIRMPWLTDSVVDTRLSQLVERAQNVILIPTFNFILWWRDWQKNKAIQDVHLKCIKDVKKNTKVLIPRVVGHKTPESGNHFILWVFDGVTSEIKLYDSLGKTKTIADQDMELLCNAFQNIWNLSSWTIQSPAQWKQSDSDNCGVLVCTMAELEVRSIKAANETLFQKQLLYLRRYHAAALAAEAILPRHAAHDSDCLAGKIYACTYQRMSGQKARSLYPDVSTFNWVQCDICEMWLHTDCAGVQQENLQNTSFKCGCDMPSPYPYTNLLSVLSQKGVGCLISEEEIQELHRQLFSGEKKSARMFLWNHPNKCMKLRTILRPRLSKFSTDRIDELYGRILAALSLDKTELRNVDYIIDVMLPEVTLLILSRHEGFNRYQGELSLSTPGVIV